MDYYAVATPDKQGSKPKESSYIHRREHVGMCDINSVADLGRWSWGRWRVSKKL